MLDRVDDIRAILFGLMLRAMRADLGRLFIVHKADLGLGGRCLPLCIPLRAIVQENGVPERIRTSDLRFRKPLIAETIPQGATQHLRKLSVSLRLNTNLNFVLSLHHTD
jgi:hypothetical protein